MRTRPIDLVDPADTLERIKARVQLTPDGCWTWTGARDLRSGGYGMIRVNCVDGARTSRPHRVTWTILKGPIPDGLVIDHIVCGNRLCCNPDHLRVVTQSENAARVALAAPERCTKCGASDWLDESDGRRCRPCWNRYFRQWQRDQKPPIECPECGLTFQRTAQNMRFCSEPCRREATLRRRRDWARAKARALRTP